MTNKHEILWSRLKTKLGNIRLWQTNQVGKKKVQTWVKISEIMRIMEEDYDKSNQSKLIKLRK
ncbi:MAG: hypothetical protein ACOCUH_02790 [Bacteriovoracia bacterium]